MIFYLKLFVIFLSVANILLCHDFPFFWDHIALVSKFANHFYENPASIPIVPAEIDHGHPTLFAVYLSAVWQILGRSLWASHLAMFPFLVLLGLQWLQLVRFFLPQKFVPLGFFALLFEPTFLSQSTMVCTEIPLLVGILMAFNGIIYYKNSLKFLGLLLCGWLSIRGSMWCMVLFLTDFTHILLFNKKTQKPYNKYIKITFKTGVSLLSPYFFAATLIILWYVYHFWASGYLLASPNGAWASDYSWNFSISYVIFSLKMLAWNIGDYGRFFYFMVFFLLISSSFLFKKIRNICFKKDKKALILINFLFNTAFVFFPVMIFRGNNLLRRYLIPFYLLALLLCLLWCVSLNKKWFSYTAISTIFILLFSGHFWIYPERYSQDWEASLAHLPYFELDRKMKQYLRAENIHFHDVSTGFPSYNADYNTILSNDKTTLVPTRKRASLSIKKYDAYPYLMDSNIFNVLMPTDKAHINNNEKWVLKKVFEHRGIYIRLYKNQQL